jgi:hypothetical protein
MAGSSPAMTLALTASTPRPAAALNLTIADDRIVGIEAVADPERLSQMELSVLNV